MTAIMPPIMDRTARPKRRLLRLVISVAFTVGILALLLWQVQPGELVQAAGQLGLGTLALALLVSALLNVFQAAEVLRRSLGVMGQPLGYGQSLGATVATLAPKMALPGGLGVVVRVLYLHRVLGLDLAGVTVSVALIPWFKLGWMLAMPLAGAALGAKVPMPALVAVGGALAAVLLLSWAAPRGGLLLLDRVAARWSRLRRLEQTLAALGKQARPWPLVVTMLHALLSAALEVLLFSVILVGVLGPVDYVAVLALFPLCALGSKVPVAFLGLGAREALVLLLLASMGSDAQLLAAALAYSAVGFLLPPLLAAPFTWRDSAYNRGQ